MKLAVFFDGALPLISSSLNRQSLTQRIDKPLRLSRCLSMTSNLEGKVFPKHQKHRFSRYHVLRGNAVSGASVPSIHNVYYSAPVIQPPRDAERLLCIPLRRPWERDQTLTLSSSICSNHAIAKGVNNRARTARSARLFISVRAGNATSKTRASSEPQMSLTFSRAEHGKKVRGNERKLIYGGS